MILTKKPSDVKIQRDSFIFWMKLCLVSFLILTELCLILKKYVFRLGNGLVEIKDLMGSAGMFPMFVA